MTFAEIAVFHHLLSRANRMEVRGEVGLCAGLGIRQLAIDMGKSRNATKKALRALESAGYVKLCKDGIFIPKFIPTSGSQLDPPPGQDMTHPRVTNGPTSGSQLDPPPGQDMTHPRVTNGPTSGSQLDPPPGQDMTHQTPEVTENKAPRGSRDLKRDVRDIRDTVRPDHVINSPYEFKAEVTIEKVAEALDDWMMDLAQWMPARFGTASVSPKYIEAVFNLVNVGNAKGLVAAKPGEVPYDLDEIEWAVRGYIVGSSRDQWLKQKQQQGEILGLYWLFTANGMIAKYAEMGREKWEKWVGENNRARAAIEASEARAQDRRTT